MRKRILIVVIVLLAALGAYLLFSDRAGKNANDQIIVSGNIELTEVNIAFKTSGRLMERTVDEGDVVKKGQLIARLDRDQLLAQRDREAAGLQSANSQLAQAETALAWQKGNQAAELEQRKAELASYAGQIAGIEKRIASTGNPGSQSRGGFRAVRIRSSQAGLGPRANTI